MDSLVFGFAVFLFVFFKDIVNYFFGLVCLHRVIFVVIISNLFCGGISFQYHLFVLDCYYIVLLL